MEAPPDTGRPRLAAKARLKWDETRQKPLLLFPEGVLVLNPTAYDVLQLCDGLRTVGEIVKALQEKFGGGTIEQDVKTLLARLVGKGLMTMAD
jgi:pyrroloquinoline quinone biosynthesis protein D